MEVGVGELEKKGDACFYCLEYKADIAPLELLAKLEFNAFHDHYPSSVIWVLEQLLVWGQPF